VVDPLDVAVVRFPRISNVTDVDALALEPGVAVRLVDSVGSLGDPDLIVLPGTKATVADLAWLRASGLDVAIARARGLVLGICGGQQMMGRSIHDPGRVESPTPCVEGLGWLDVTTTFAAGKVLAQRRGTVMGAPVHGYAIHHGVASRGPSTQGWVHLDDEHGRDDDGAVELSEARFIGTSLHGLFESDDFRDVFLTEVGRRAGKTFVSAGVSFARAREAQIDAVADLLAEHLDLAAVDALIAEGAR
jgi:adenosylcobyric acid synthase